MVLVYAYFTRPFVLSVCRFPLSAYTYPRKNAIVIYTSTLYASNARRGKLFICVVVQTVFCEQRTLLILFVGTHSFWTVSVYYTRRDTVYLAFLYLKFLFSIFPVHSVQYSTRSCCTFELSTSTFVLDFTFCTSFETT